MATTTRTIEKGIREITYHNKDGEVVKYQVRIHTKELPNFNVLVESLDVAKEIVANAKSSAGRELIKTLKIKANEPKKKTKEEKVQSLLNVFDSKTDDEVLKEVFNDESLEVFLNHWFTNHIEKKTDNEVDLKNNKTYQSSIKTICNTKIVDWYKHNRIIENVPINMRGMISEPKKVSIGDISIFELTGKSWLEYINNRLAQGLAKSTVAREISIISSMYNKLYLLGDRYKQIENPIDKTHKFKLKNSTKKRDIRVTIEDEVALEKALNEARNKDLINVFALALATGCRRSEVLFWEWKHLHLDENYYHQIRTKTDNERKIKLFPEAKKIIEKIEKKPDTDRLFSYSIEGFKTMWQRAREKASEERPNVKNIQFRDLRNEFISRLLEKTNNNYIAVSSVAGIKNQSYFAQSHGKAKKVRDFLQSDTVKVEDVPAQVGHSTFQMTSHYNRENYENDGSVTFRIEELKLKKKFNKITNEEEKELLELLLLNNELK